MDYLQRMIRVATKNDKMANNNNNGVQPLALVTGNNGHDVPKVAETRQQEER